MDVAAQEIGLTEDVHATTTIIRRMVLVDAAVGHIHHTTSLDEEATSL